MTAERFPVFSRLLHWLMAAMILAMLFIGIGMVASLGNYHWLVSIHRPLGVANLILVAIRLVNRQINPPPPLPRSMPPLLRFAALGSHVLLYALMFAVPLVGWGMLSAARYPIVLYGALELPPILPQSDMLFAILRTTHTVLALLLFAVFLAHLGAALMHAFVFRDGVFESMATASVGKPGHAPRSRAPESTEAPTISLYRRRAAERSARHRTGIGSVGVGPVCSPLASPLRLSSARTAG